MAATIYVVSLGWYSSIRGTVVGMLYFAVISFNSSVISN